MLLKNQAFDVFAICARDQRKKVSVRGVDVTSAIETDMIEVYAHVAMLLVGSSQR